MHDRFLAGGDAEFFDYAEVDCNDKYDDSKVKDQDEEDSWFDQDQPDNTAAIAIKKESEYTGVLDY